MKIFFIILFISINAAADCDAPDLRFKDHVGSIHQFSIISFMEGEKELKTHKNSTLFVLGDYTFSLTPEKNQKQIPKKVDVTKTVSDKISASFRSSPNYLDGIKQSFELVSTQGLDLNGDTKADVVIFEVSPGANVYSGAIAIINGELFTLIKPSCY